MEQVDIRDYLYHGISNSNSEFGALFILDSILKTEYLVNSRDCRKYGVKSIYDTYPEMGYTPRISLGFYPLDQKTYELSKRRHPNYYGSNIIEKIMMEHKVNEENIDSSIHISSASIPKSDIFKSSNNCLSNNSVIPL